MPNPMPPASRKHGTGDRNDNEVARRDHERQQQRDTEEAREARDADRAARRKEGFDHP